MTEQIIDTTAEALRVGDVFTVADGRGTAPLYISESGYISHRELIVTEVDTECGDIRSRRIKFGFANDGGNDSNLRVLGKLFENSHPVTIVKTPEWERELMGESADELARQLRVAQVDLAEAKALAEARQGRIEEMRRRGDEERARNRRDWEAINEHMNQYADKVSWCDEYENIHLSEMNELISTFQFTGRTKTYRVAVTLTSTYHGSVEVEASSPEQAESAVHEMGNEEIYREAGWMDAYRNSATDDVEVDEVESA